MARRATLGTAFYRPQLATLVKHAPAGAEWIHEIKLDGYRIGCKIHGGRATLWSRNGNDWTASFPAVREAATRLGVRDGLLDGEVAAMGTDGRTSFQLLQNMRTGDANAQIVYFVFDLLELEGRDLRELPLEQRKIELARLLEHAPAAIRYSAHVENDGARVLREACKIGLEGIVSKRRDRPYRAGRNTDWLKVKCSRRQELVIGGFTLPDAGGPGIGALLVGFYEAGGLVFGGKVGTGWSHAVSRELRSTLEQRAQDRCPFANPPNGALRRTAHWVRPELVAEIQFLEWTADRKIRHSSFQGLREDRNPTDVVFEQPVEQPVASAPATSAKPARRRSKPPPDRPTIAGVPISHPDRVVYPDEQLTKLDVARYYEQVAAQMLPHLQDRPLTLVMCPEGLSGACQYMKHSKVWTRGASIRRVRIQEATKLGEYLIVDDLPALISLVQMNILEIHTWNTRYAKVDRPDRIVIDLDPGPLVAWASVVGAAHEVRDAFEAIGLTSFVKTTGGAGLHVVAPIVADRDVAGCVAVALALAEALVARAPDRYTTKVTKAGREDKILVDYLRNHRTNTSVAAYSTRARAGAPISTPMRWEELKPDLQPSRFTVTSIPRRLSRLRDEPWMEYFTTRQRLGPRAEQLARSWGDTPRSSAKRPRRRPGR
ncbi:MAG: DNA ligase D [Kofleriaceae bacterium]